MVNDDRNPLWPATAVLASIWAGIAAAVLIAAILAGPIQDSEALKPQYFHYQVYVNYSNRLDAAAMENRIRAQARAIGIPDENLICLLSECRQSQTVRPIIYVRTTLPKGRQLWEFTQDAMKRELDRLENTFPATQRDPSITKSNDCSEW